MAEALQLEPVDEGAKTLQLEPVGDAPAMPGATTQPLRLEPVNAPTGGTLYTRLTSILAKAFLGVQQQQAAEITETSKVLGNPIINVTPRDIIRLAPPIALLPDEIGKGVAEGVANLATAATVPKNALLGVATAIQPEVGLGVMAGIGAKGAGEKLGEASVEAQQGHTKEAARLTTEGLGEGAMAALPVLHTALGAARSVPPVIERPPQVELNLNSPRAPGTDTPIPSTATPQVQGAMRIAASPIASLPENVRQVWREVANEAMPRITSASREAGELGVRSVTASQIGRATGEVFAENVMRGLDLDPREFGAALVEDNLRSRKADLRAKAQEALTEARKQDTLDNRLNNPDADAQIKRAYEDAQTLAQSADTIGTVVGAKDSPFATLDDWQAYLKRPNVQEAIKRHTQLWTEQKDPLFRQANDLDPEAPLASRGELTGARLNMRSIPEGETSPTAIAVHDTPDAQARVGLGEQVEPGTNYRPTLIRQMATLQKRDPFARSFTGLGHAYEADYVELMRHGFGREMPVAAQHEFIRSLVANKQGVLADSSYMPDLTINGEPTQGYLQTMKPWTGRYLHLPKSLAAEYENATGLRPSERFEGLQRVSNVFTRASIQGLAEGTTHMSNLLSQVITGPGPTSNPLLNGLLKSLGRPDLLYTIPRVFLRAMNAPRAEMIDLMAIGAAKEPYTGGLLGRRLLDPTDRGVRLVSADLYDAFDKAGWLKASETGKREFINQVGNYNKSLQPRWLRFLRETVQPFATAGHSFTIMGLRRMVGSAGIRDLTPTQRAAFAADVYGGWLGFISLGAGIMYLLNHNDSRVENPILGPTGTHLGDIGWLDEDGKVHTIPLASIAGYNRGLRSTGILPAAEALHRGLPLSSALDEGAKAIGQTAANYVTGPMVRSAFVAATGKTPTMTLTQEAPVVPPAAPGDPFNPMRSQFVSNIGTALKEANPLIDVGVSAAQAFHNDSYHNFLQEAGQKLFGRFYPRTPSQVQASSDFAEIVTKAKLNDYVDDVVKRARKLPEDERPEFVQDALDRVPDDLYKSARQKLKQKGAAKPDR